MRRVGTHGPEIRGVAFHPSGDSVASLNSAGEIRVWDASGGSPEPIRTIETGGLSTLGYGPHGRWLKSDGAVDGRATVHLWDLEAPNGTSPLALTRSDNTFANPSSFHPGAEWLVTPNAFTAGFWPLTHRHPRVLEHGGRLGDLAFTPDGAWLVTLTFEGRGDSNEAQVRSWPMTGMPGGQSRVLFEAPAMALYNCSLAIHPSGELVAVSTRGGTVHLLPIEGGQGRELVNPPGADGGRDLLAVSPDGMYLAAVGRSGFSREAAEADIRVWNLESGEGRAVSRVTGHTNFLGFISNRRVLWSASALQGKGGGERVFDLEAETVEVWSERGTEVSRAISPDGSSMLRALAAGAERTEIAPEKGELIWSEFETGATRHITTHGAPYAGAIDPSNRWLASAGLPDGIVRIGPITGVEPHLLYGHRGNVWAVAFSPDGRWLASAGDDRTVRLWPVPDHEKLPLHTLPHDELMAKLKTLTNLRVVRDDESSTGWTLDYAPFPGWETPPEW
jgi:WD40 repeat protein